MTLGPNFGCAAATSQVSRNQTAEFAELMDGYNKDYFWKMENDQRAEQREVLSGWGIAASTSNPLGAKLESITITETEEVIKHDKWSGEEADTVAQGRPLLVCDGLLVIRKNTTWSISGDRPQGVLNSNLTACVNKLGLEVGNEMIFSPATGATGSADTYGSPTGTNIVVPATAIVQQPPGRTRTQGDFEKFQIQLVKSYGNDSGNSEKHFWTTGDMNIANAAVFPISDLPNKRYKITRTQSLSASNYVTVNWSLEVYPTV